MATPIFDSQIPTYRVYRRSGAIDLTGTADGTTLGSAYNGINFICTSSGGDNWTLPAPAGGLTYRWTTGAALSSARTIATSGGSNIIYGGVSGPDVATGNYASGTAQDTVTFSATGETIGDWIELTSDGTNWYLTGWCAVATAISLSVT